MTTRLLNPEWQGYGESTEVFHGARALAAEIWRDRDVLTIDAPEVEALTPVEGVLGLASIAERFSGTLALLRTRAPRRIYSIGGTCGTELAPVAYLNDLYLGELAVLWIDAHADLNTPASSPSGHFHGMVLRTLVGEGPDVLTREIARPLTPSQVFLVGPRDLDPPESEFVARAPIAHVGLEAFDDPDRLVRMVRDRGFTHVYVHFDVDVIDPQSLPAALLRVPGGPTAEQTMALIARVHDAFDVVGFSVLEYCARSEQSERRFVELLRTAHSPLSGS